MIAFLIYSFSDRKKIKPLVGKLNQTVKTTRLRCKFDPIWKLFSYRCIKKADFVILILGEESSKSDNIKWEIEIAQKMCKEIYIIKLSNNAKMAEQMKDLAIIEEDEIPTLIDKQNNCCSEKIKSSLFNEQQVNDNVLYDEYKLIVQTSENLVTRRQNVNTFYLTANGVLISLIGLIKNISVTSHTLFYAIMPLVGIAISISWRKMIKSYGQLNAGKFAVINTIEKKLPLSIFNAEWIALGQGRNKKIYTPFTQKEASIPILFLVAYIVILAMIFMDLFCPNITKMLKF